MSPAPEFDLHIKVGLQPYNEEGYRACTVTFPDLRGIQPPMTVNYISGHDGTSDLSSPIERAAEDIAKFMSNPTTWMEQCIATSGEAWQSLREARIHQKKLHKEIENYRKYLAEREERLTRLEEYMKELEADVQLEQELQAEHKQRGHL